MPLYTLTTAWQQILQRLKAGGDADFSTGFKIDEKITLVLNIQDIGGQLFVGRYVADLSVAVGHRIIQQVPANEIWRVRAIMVDATVGTLAVITVWPGVQNQTQSLAQGAMVTGNAFMYMERNVGTPARILPSNVEPIGGGNLPTGWNGAMNLTLYAGDAIGVDSTGNAGDNAVDTRVLYDRLQFG